ncbi:DUF3613 domain-containing protein [Pseudothauera rhizosphaerae]|uniref:DUF3613 domain-containing protein n=1 Tax=Pseudothauera rhizosphaerae TaxID=2565932 RepID=A0A4S4AYP7_9RHOO|nr:DUF3613 domain-containing protein [Pseudothauera rhizosphaerae]THF64458.1 DUF3613 domain-containing protein [Pseudothauera rhizosphaerae]
MKRCRLSLPGALLALALPLAAAAADTTAVATAHPVAPHPQSAPANEAAPAAAATEPTRAWLALQRSGAAASAQPQPLSGEVMEKVYERYLESFAHPVPDELDPRSESR